jgi:hypothetical protein
MTLRIFVGAAASASLLMLAMGAPPASVLAGALGATAFGWWKAPGRR